MGKPRTTRLEYVVTSIQQRFGPDAVRRGPRSGTISVISTGFAELDAATGIGGIPRGRVTTIAGRATCGKRTLAARVLAQAQRGNALAVYLDVSSTCDADMLSRLGVNLNNLLVVRPEDGRQALDMLGVLADRPEVAVVIFDCWCDLRADPNPRLLGRRAAATLDVLGPRLKRSRVAVVVIEETVGTADDHPSGHATEDTVALDALGQVATLRVVCRRRQWLRRAGEPDVYGYRIEARVEKNKLGPAGGKAELDLAAAD